MHREWSIADGPADLGPKDVGQIRTFTIILANGRPTQCLMDILTVGNMHGTAVHSFGGRLHVQRQIVDVVGTYNTHDRTGHCYTTA